MDKKQLLEELKLSDNVLAHKPSIRIIDFVLNRQKQEICNNCKHGQLSWIALDGQDIRNSQYPPLVECKEKLREPDWYCADFELKE